MTVSPSSFSVEIVLFLYQLGWNLAFSKIPLDADFRRHDGYEHRALPALRRTPQSGKPPQNATPDP
jgi:hypothetical protein